MAGKLVDRPRAGLHGPDRAWIVEINTQKHLAAVQAGIGHSAGVVPGKAVIHLEAGTRQSPAVHRAVHELVIERTEQGQLLDDVRRPEETCLLYTSPSPRDGLLSR